MVYCANCGKQLDDDSNFCSRCGTRTPKGVKEGVSIPFTETQMRQDIERAVKQASKAIDEGVRVAQTSLKDVANRIDEDVRSMREKRKEKPGVVFCPSCGAENSPDTKFCTKCGKELV